MADEAGNELAIPSLPGRRVLVLQGGGALGSYQAGVFAALDSADYCPQWVAGISIGAINAALIAGNPPDRRRQRLTAFWERVTGHLPWDWLDDAARPGADMLSAARHQ
jgi:NTE family protein